MVVDAPAVARDALHTRLAGWGCEVDSADTADAAVELVMNAIAAGRPFAAGLVGHVPPVLDAVALAQRLRADAASSPPLVLLAGRGARTGVAAEDSLFVAQVAKPGRHEDLARALATALGAVQRTVPSRSRESGPPIHARVLLAEDNRINQQVAVHQLEQMGCRVDVADDGIEAVARFALGTYDIVLMDCQMPGQDGFAATAAIRALEGAACHTPIVALTAHAMEGDRERCLAAGMDDYLSKPVKAGELRVVLERWVRRIERPAGIDADPASRGLRATP